MKQGTLINRIVMLLLLAAVLVYLGVSAAELPASLYPGAVLRLHCDDSLEATGFLVREESVLASPGRGLWICCPRRGRRSPAGRRWPCSTRMTPAWRGRRSYRA